MVMLSHREDSVLFKVTLLVSVGGNGSSFTSEVIHLKYSLGQPCGFSRVHPYTSKEEEGSTTMILSIKYRMDYCK